MRSVLLLLLLLLLAACAPPPAPRAPSSPTAASDMCEEHGVLEALCTKHHPTLIAVFQAKGDWCEEHGFAESICPQCHPERGGRPAVDVSVKDDGPADGTPVRLKSADLVQKAGIVTVRAVEKQNGPSLSAVARFVYDASRVALVNARSPGVVREVRADVGARVKKGQTLAVIDSAAVGADRSGLVAARARLQVAQSTVTRVRELVTTGIAAQKELQKAEQEASSAAADVAAAESAVAVTGGGGGGEGAAGVYFLSAPLSGVVVQRNLAIGQTVGVEALLFQIVDPSSLWAEIDVQERDLALVAEGQSVELVVDALPERRFSGTIASIAPFIDVHTRTAPARVAVKNDDGALRAHMFAEARIAVGAARAAVMVPRAAVQRAKSVQLVFVQKGAGVYEARRVTLGLVDGADVEVVKGVVAGEDVVTAGSFFLKTETLRGALGAGCCD